mgnify:CR=1 FL=1
MELNTNIMINLIEKELFKKIALASALAGIGTGTYGLFRDISSPFGIAIFVPMFTNSILNNISSGLTPANAAVSAIRTLAIAEVVCVAIGIVVIGLLPKKQQ